MEKENYTVTFQRAIDKTLGWEGGYSNDPEDPGGETNWGIAARWHPDLDIKNLTRDGAIAIYHQGYWMPMRLDALRDTRLAMKIFDTVVNQDRRIGPGALQGALILLGQNLQLDYKIGPLTIAAANSYQYPEALLEVYTVLRGMAYFLGAENIEEVRAMIRERKPRLKKNVRGWMVRLELGALIALFALATGCVPSMSGKEMAAVVAELKNDSASVCFALTGRGGAGMMAATPVPIPAGGYGSGEAFFCRSNQPDARITAESGKLTIEHGAGVKESPEARTVIQRLLERGEPQTKGMP